MDPGIGERDVLAPTLDVGIGTGNKVCLVGRHTS